MSNIQPMDMLIGMGIIGTGICLGVVFIIAFVIGIIDEILIMIRRSGKTRKRNNERNRVRVRSESRGRTGYL